MSDTAPMATGTSLLAELDRQRGFYYAAGAGLASFCLVVLLSSLASYRLPILLSSGIGLGIVCWLGVELGHRNWQRAERARPGSGRPRVRWALGMGALSFVLGLLVMLPHSSAVGLIAAIILAEATLAALFHGYLTGATGARARPRILIGMLMAPVWCVLAGLLFGLGAAVTYALTYQPSICEPSSCLFPNGPAFGMAILVILASAIGLALGICLSAASACGLWARPFTRRAPVER